jgi:uncharacterized protein DUF3237
MSAPEPVVPTLEHLMRVEAELGEPLEVGTTPAGRRRVIPIAGGRFEGERLRGEVLPGGADTQMVLPDGTAVIDTRYTLRTDDGALIAIATQGVRAGAPETLAALARGELVDPADYYFRVLVRLEAAGAYEWLGRLLVVASAVRTANAVAYDAYVVT